MDSRAIRVLLIEDDEDDAFIVREMLNGSLEVRFDVESADRLGGGLELVKSHSPDVVLLDLSLPDSSGLETFRRVHGAAPEVPIIVLTGLADDSVALRAVRSGAHDYLVKGDASPGLLVRSIRYAIERQRLLGELEVARQQQAQQRELGTLEGLQKAEATRDVGAARSVREGHPEAFAQMVQRCSKLLDAAADLGAPQVVMQFGDELRAIAETLGELQGRPRDVVQIYREVLRQRCNDGNARWIQASIEEGRHLVLELMGQLALFYRQYYRPSA